MAGYLKGNDPIGGTHFALNHDCGKKSRSMVTRQNLKKTLSLSPCILDLMDVQGDVAASFAGMDLWGLVVGCHGCITLFMSSLKLILRVDETRACYTLED